MRKRQDILYSVFYEIFYPEKDLIIIDIPVKTDLPLVFALAHRKKVKQLLDKNIDVKFLSGVFEIKNLNNNFNVLA